MSGRRTAHYAPDEDGQVTLQPGQESPPRPTKPMERRYKFVSKYLDILIIKGQLISKANFEVFI